MPSKTAKGWARPLQPAEIPPLSVSCGEIKTLEDLRRHIAEEQYQHWMEFGEAAEPVGESTGFERVGRNSLRCSYYFQNEATGRTKKGFFTVIFADNSATVEDTDVLE
jgi:hypothetical protein